MNPTWLNENVSMVVKVKDIASFYNVSPNKVRSTIKKLGFTENVDAQNYRYIFDSYFYKSELKAIHEKLSK